MSKRKGFSKFICKVEGIKPIEPRLSCSLPLDAYLLPDDYNPSNLRRLVKEVMEAGINGVLVDSGLVDTALIWDTHLLEDVWAELYESALVTPEVYSVCQHWESLEF